VKDHPNQRNERGKIFIDYGNEYIRIYTISYISAVTNYARSESYIVITLKSTLNSISCSASYQSSLHVL
jgi:hypothetical protein